MTQTQSTPTPFRVPAVDHVAVYDANVRGRVLIYLDTNIWIDLADAKTDAARRCVETCRTAVGAGLVLFPLSNASISELLDQPPEALPAGQADLMDELSLRVSFRAMHEVWADEVRRFAKAWPPDAVLISDPSLIFTTAAGTFGDGRLSFRGGRPDRLVERAELLRDAVARVGVRWMLDHLPVEKMRAAHARADQQYVAKMTESYARTRVQAIDGSGRPNRFRMLRVEREWAFRTYVAPGLLRGLVEGLGPIGAAAALVSHLALHGPGGPRRFDKLMFDLPSLDLHTEIVAHRALDAQHVVSLNDRYDDDHASLAPAYVAAFATADAGMRALIKKCRTPRARGCRLLNDVGELLAFVERILGRHDRH